MMRRVVFNADDFGASPAENAGVLEAARAGIVREVSLLVTTGAAVDDAVKSLRASGIELGVGLHFSLTVGRALRGPILGVTGADGQFLSLSRLLPRALARRIDPAPIEDELRAQLDRLVALGFRPTHLNAHHHVHVFPGVREAVLAVLRDFPGLHVRVPLERPFVSPSARRAVIAALAAAFLIRASGEISDFRRLPFVGLALSEERDHARAFAELARQLPTPVAEWIVHPTPRELETLVNPKTRALLSELAIEPSRYSDLADSGGNGAASAGRVGLRS